MAKPLNQASITSSLDDRGAIPPGVSSKAPVSLQYVQNSAARVLIHTTPRQYITPHAHQASLAPRQVSHLRQAPPAHLQTSSSSCSSLGVRSPQTTHLIPDSSACSPSPTRLRTFRDRAVSILNLWNALGQLALHWAWVACSVTDASTS